ncbi:MAG: hypothetical protein V3W20_06510 [Candidatus Neomarinimicrobiota bacterium]
MTYYRYLMITHHMHPSKEHKTEMKDWGTKGKKKVEEYTEFSQKISNRNLTEATYIYDIKENKMAKNRYRDNDKKDSMVTDENVIEYIMKEYKGEMVKMGWPNDHWDVKNEE